MRLHAVAIPTRSVQSKRSGGHLRREANRCISILFTAGILLVLPLAGQETEGDDKITWWAPQFEYNQKQSEIIMTGQDGVRAWIMQSDARINAERIFWNRNTRTGRCYDNVEIISYTNDSVITGNEAWHYANDSHTLVRGNPVLTMNQEKDTNMIIVYAEEMHRYGNAARSEALRSVRIESEDGTAYGNKAVYYQRTGQIVLSEDPWIVQKTNTHRAEVITLFREENRVVLKGRARMMQDGDYVCADEIEIIDYDQTNSASSASSSSMSSGSSSSSDRKNRVVFCRGDVRIYRYTNKGALESITSGDYGELYEQRGYAKLDGNTQMVMVSDNTITSGAVMEQFQDEDLAVVKGNANITKGYRSIDAQLITYDTKTKIAKVSGNPVVREYGDYFRSNYVEYDTEREVISWRGDTIGIFESGDEKNKRESWIAKTGGGVYTLSPGQNGFQVIKSVGNVWLSMNGTPKTNDGIVSYGKRANEEDFIPRGTHMIIRDSWSWIDLLAQDGMMLRLRGPAHCILAAAAWREAVSASSPQNSRQPAEDRGASGGQSSSQDRGAPGSQSAAQAGGFAQADPASGENAVGVTAPPGESLRRVLYDLWERDDARSFSDPPEPPSPLEEAADLGFSMMEPVLSVLLGGAHAEARVEDAESDEDDESDVGSMPMQPGGRLGQMGFTLHYGIMLVKPGGNSVADIQNDYFICTNIGVPFLIDADQEQRIRMILLSNQAACFAWAHFPALDAVTMRNDEEKQDFVSGTGSLRYALPNRIPVILGYEPIRASDAVMYEYITNALTNRMFELESIASSNVVEPVEESPKAITNRILIQAPLLDIMDGFMETLTNVAATNYPDRPFSLVIPEGAASLPPELRPEVYWEGDLRTFVLRQIGGKSFWSRGAFPGQQTDYFDLIAETEALEIRYGSARRPRSSSTAATN